MSEKPTKIPTLPPFRSTGSPEKILNLLKDQESKGEQLLKKGFLSIEDVRNWNVSTKKILTKAFGSNWDYIHSILYAGEQKHYPAFEPESSLEKKRRNNFQLALNMLRGCIDQMSAPTIRLEPDEEEALPEDLPEPPPPTLEHPKEEKLEKTAQIVSLEESGGKSQGRKVLLLHGADGEKKEAVIDFLKNLDFEPVLPGNGAAGGKVIEAFEADPNIVFALALLDAEEYGYPKGKPDQGKPRAAQKLMFELGYVTGRLKKNLICALYEEGLDFPAEYRGEIFVPLDSGGLWKLIVARAMKMAEVEVDLNKAI